MAFKMRGFPMQNTSALKQTDDDFDKLSEKEKLELVKKEVAKEQRSTDIGFELDDLYRERRNATTQVKKMMLTKKIKELEAEQKKLGYN